MPLIKSYMSSVLTFLNELLLYRVKLAIDLKTKKQVAVKILKVKEGKATEFSKYQSLDCFHMEIKILSECDHKNIVKIKATSFDGTILRQMVPQNQDSDSMTDSSNSSSPT